MWEVTDVLSVPVLFFVIGFLVRGFRAKAASGGFQLQSLSWHYRENGYKIRAATERKSPDVAGIEIAAENPIPTRPRYILNP